MYMYIYSPNRACSIGVLADKNRVLGCVEAVGKSVPVRFVQGFVLLFAFRDQKSANYARIYRVPESPPSFCARIYTIFCIRQTPKIIKISKT